jgi:hypothetical protein
MIDSADKIARPASNYQVMQVSQIKEYRISPELRRSCWYVILSVPILLAVFCWVAGFVQKRGVFDIVSGCIIFSLLAGAMAIPLCWKLRFDATGVSRRWLFSWDLWSWSELASGRILKLHPYTLRDPIRSWWCQKLRLSFMASADIKEVMRAINAHYRLPPPPSIAETLTIRYGLRSALFDTEGIHTSRRGKRDDCPWEKIKHVHLTRMDAVRRDFSNLVIALPDCEIELKLVTHQGGTSPSWRGATAEEINEFLFRHVPADRLTTFIAGETPTTREGIEKQLRTARSSRRHFQIIAVFFAPLLAVTLAWMAVQDGIMKAAAMAVVMAIHPGSVLVFLYRAQGKRIRELEILLDADEQIEHSPVSQLHAVL